MTTDALPSERGMLTPEERLRAAIALPDKICGPEIESAEQYVRDRHGTHADEIIRRVWAEAEHDRDIRAARTAAIQTLLATVKCVRELRRTVEHLTSERLFDVEVEGKAEIFAAALTQADVALLAVGGLLPDPDQ